jgi:putative DNA primase/helicase
MAERLAETARGRWHGILPQLGISPKLLRNRHGPCPMCGGKDRFRFDNKEGKGTWICNRCGSGDGAELVKRVKGVQFKEAAKMVEGCVGNAPVRPILEKLATPRLELARIWDAAKPIKRPSPVADYLAKRCDWTENYSENLRENGTLMLAKVQTWDGKGVNIHRTHIADDKATVRKLMPGKLPDGSAIRLAYVNLWTEMGVAEGIETALSAMKLFGLPTWSLINATLMQKWRPPVGIKKVVIFGDNDKSFTGQMAAYTLAYKLRDSVEVEVKIPTMPGWDWNDVHRNNLDNR